MTHNATVNSKRLYSSAASAGLQSSAADRPSDTDLLKKKLKEDLRDLLARHPQGVCLSKARRSCHLLLDPKMLNDHASVRELLKSMPDVVELQGFGVQTIIHPAAL